MNATFDPFPLLITERLVLRKLLPGDVHEVFFLRSNDIVLKYIDTPPAVTLEEANMFIRRVDGLEKENECVNWAMVLKDETRMFGTICFWNLEKEKRKAEVGYSMHPAYYGNGYMQEAMAAILRYGFETMQLKRVEAITNKDNTRSRRLLERNNFKRDAAQEQERVGTEEPEYAVIYSLWDEQQA